MVLIYRPSHIVFGKALEIFIYSVFVKEMLQIFVMVCLIDNTIELYGKSY